MRSGLVVTLALLAMAGSACGSRSAADSTQPAVFSASKMSLPCPVADQTGLDLDVPGPGQPTPEEAVAPYAGALTLVAEQVDGRTIVLGLRGDGSVFREYQVTEREDGWWPDGYHECSG